MMAVSDARRNHQVRGCSHKEEKAERKTMQQSVGKIAHRSGFIGALGRGCRKVLTSVMFARDG